MKEGYSHDRVTREFKESDCYVLLCIVIFTGICSLMLAII